MNALLQSENSNLGGKRVGERGGKMLVGPGRPYDLVAVCLLAAGAVMFSLSSPDNPLTWTLGFLAVFFAPGYAIISALFPGNREILAQSFVTRREERTFNITLLERIALSFGMSAVVMAIVGTFLARVVSSLNLIMVALSVVALTGIISAYAVYRRSGLPPGDQFAVFTRPRTGASVRRGASRGEMGISAVVVAGLVLAGAVAVNGYANDPGDSENFSEFSISGADGNLQQLPQQASPGQFITVRITVTSHYSDAREMSVTISAGSPVNGDGNNFQAPPTMAGALGPRTITFTLGSGNQWSYPITFSAGTGPIYFVLDDGNEVKTLWMPLAVSGPSGGGD